MKPLSSYRYFVMLSRPGEPSDTIVDGADTLDEARRIASALNKDALQRFGPPKTAPFAVHYARGAKGHTPLPERLGVEVTFGEGMEN